MHPKTGFTIQVYSSLYDVIKEPVETQWSSGRGRRTTFSTIDLFFLTLVTLKLARNWDYMAGMFRLNAPAFQRAVVSYIQLIILHLYEEAVTNRATFYCIARLIEEKKLF